MTSEQGDEVAISVCEPVGIDVAMTTMLDTETSSSNAGDFPMSDPSAVCVGSSNGEQSDDIEVAKCSSEDVETVEFKVVYNKQTYDVTFPLDSSVSSLKKHIEELTEVPVEMQKIMFKGRMKEDVSLRENKVVKGSKIMVIGSTVNDVMSVSQAAPKTKKEATPIETSSKEPLCKQKAHKTVLDKHGKPDDAMIGIKKSREPLPPVPLSGMYNKSGGKVRLTFKLESDQVWIGTKERTEKLSLASIKSVVSEPIEGHEEYQIMALQLGPTEASRYWIYWVPSQYVDAIKDAILGNWQYFQ